MGWDRVAMEEVSALQVCPVRFVQLLSEAESMISSSRLTPIVDHPAATLLFPSIIKRNRAGASSLVKIWLVFLGSGNRRGRRDRKEIFMSCLHCHSSHPLALAEWRRRKWSDFTSWEVERELQWMNDSIVEVWVFTDLAPASRLSPPPSTSASSF